MIDALLLTSWVLCQGLDGATTAIALNRGGFHEGNPLMRGPHSAYVKVGVNIGALIAQKIIIEPRMKPFVRLVFDSNGSLVRVEEQRGSKWRYAIPIAYAATGCLAGGVNLHTLAKGAHR